MHHARERTFCNALQGHFSITEKYKSQHPHKIWMSMFFDVVWWPEICHLEWNRVWNNRGAVSESVWTSAAQIWHIKHLREGVRVYISQRSNMRSSYHKMTVLSSDEKTWFHILQQCYIIILGMVVSHVLLVIETNLKKCIHRAWSR